jgi:hypothetical protein
VQQTEGGQLQTIKVDVQLSTVRMLICTHKASDENNINHIICSKRMHKMATATKSTTATMMAGRLNKAKATSTKHKHFLLDCTIMLGSTHLQDRASIQHSHVHNFLVMCRDPP